MHNLTSHEEAPPSQLLTRPTQFFQLEQLSYGTPPTREKDLMTAPIKRRRPLLETRMIRRNSTEILPDPLQQLLALLHAPQIRRVHPLQPLDVLVAERIVVLHEPGPHDQDIAESDFGALVREDLLQMLELDGRALEGLE